MSNFYITAITNPIASTETTNRLSEEQLKSSESFIGHNAGICYMNNKYYGENGIISESPEKTNRRLLSTISNSHHSVADHYRVTILFEDISKMLAMVLNSFQDYSTSEKSGRYTVMSASSELEKDLYDKWKDICKDLIMKNGESDTNKATKLGQENARYFLSVFTKSTTMSYSTSIRQWNYISDWAYDLYNILINNDNNYFNTKLSEELLELYSMIKESGMTSIGNGKLRDNKHREIPFLMSQYNDKQSKDPITYFKDYEHFGYDYFTSYKGSFVQLAQAQRHRTIKYHIDFDGYSKEFYIPLFIKGTEYEDKWIEDMNLVKHLVPQGTMISILENGDLASFFLKCDERMCTRAQLEICSQTANTLVKYFLYCEGIDEENKIKVFKPYIEKQKVTDSQFRIDVYTKCKILGSCNEICGNANKCFSRLY